MNQRILEDSLEFVANDVNYKRSPSPFIEYYVNWLNCVRNRLECQPFGWKVKIVYTYDALKNCNVDIFFIMSMLIESDDGKWNGLNWFFFVECGSVRNKFIAL